MTASKRVVAACLASALILLVPLAATPVLPLIDFYNHIARFFVLSHLGGDPVLSANYAATWALLPNLGLDVIATPLLAVAPPLLAAKLIIGLILLVQFSGALFLHRSLNKQADILPAVLLLGLLYSYVLVWGFGNFLLALGLAFWNLGLWFRLRDRLRLAIPLCSLGAVVIFFCHGFAFAIYGVLLGGIEFGRWLGRSDRDFGSLARMAAALAAQAVVPAILFLRMPTSTASGKSGSTFHAIAEYTDSGLLADRLDFEFWYRLRTIFRVAESPYAMLDIATFTLVVGIIAVALWKGWFRLNDWCRPALALFAILCVVMPPSLFGVGYVSDRLPLIFALLLVVALASARPMTEGGKVAIALLAAIGLIRVAAITYGWAEYARHYADFRQVMTVIPKGALVTDVLPSGQDRRDGLLPRCQMYRPLTVALNNDVTALFASSSQQPMRLIGPVNAAQGDTIETRDQRVRPDRGYFDDELAKIVAASRYDYVLMCGRERLTRPLPTGAKIVAEKGGISVIKVD